MRRRRKAGRLHLGLKRSFLLVSFLLFFLLVSNPPAIFQCQSKLFQGWSNEALSKPPASFATSSPYSNSYQQSNSTMQTSSVILGATAAGVSESVSPQLNQGSIGLSSGLSFYETAQAPTSCVAPMIDTNLTQPPTSSSFKVRRGSSVCLWSPKFSNSSSLIPGNWVLDLYASASNLGTMDVSIYTTNSTGAVNSTILSNVPSAIIQTSESETLTSLSGSSASLGSGGYLEAVLSAPYGGPRSFTIYWGSGQLTSFESPVQFDNVLAINNTSSARWYANLAVENTSNTARISNLTVWFSSSPSSPEISLGSTVTTQQLQGPQIVLTGTSTVYLCLEAKSTSFGTSTVIISLKIQSFPSGPYSQDTIALQLN